MSEIRIIDRHSGAEGNFYSNLFRESASMARTMILFEDLGMHAAPSVFSDRINQTARYFEKAEEGFMISSRREDGINFGKILESFNQHHLAFNGKDDRKNKWLSKIDKMSAQGSLQAYWQALVTLGYLYSKSDISFSDIPTQVDNLDLGRKEFTPTVWVFSLKPEGIWEKLTDLEEIVRGLSSDCDAHSDYDILRLGHFFAAGSEVTSKFTV